MNDMHEQQIETLLKSLDVMNRLRGLKLIQAAANELPLSYLDLATDAIEDADNDCRWQAFIAVGEFINRAPLKVWEIVKRCGVSADEDMRDATATILLEHLLDVDFDAFFSYVRCEIEIGPIMLLDTLRRCWPLEHSQRRWSEVVAYLRLKGIEPALTWEQTVEGDTSTRS